MNKGIPEDKFKKMCPTLWEALQKRESIILRRYGLNIITKSWHLEWELDNRAFEAFKWGYNTRFIKGIRPCRN
jgi:hypothetical protein